MNRTRRILCLLALAAPGLGSAQFLPIGETFVVTKTTDSNDGACDADCSLREAVIAANGNSNAGFVDRIVLAPGTYELTLAGRDEELAATGDLDILQEVEILGHAHRPTIVDANQIDRVFHVWVVPGAPDVTGDGVGFINLTITGGEALAGTFFPGTGGGIRSAGDVGVYRCTISGNHAQELGGGIDGANGGLSIWNSTISGNTTDGSGGGISMLPISLDPPELDLIFSTVADNSALISGSAIATLPNGGAPVIQTIFNSIIVGDCDLALPVLFANNAQWSVESPANTCGLFHANNLVSVSAADLKLGALADYGGPTYTHALFAGSAAIDLIPTGGLCPSTPWQGIRDQRQLSRLFDGDGDGENRCDAGAFEVQPLSIFADGFETGDTFRWSASLP